MQVKIQRLENIDPLVYIHEGDAAFDLRSAEELVVKPNETKVVRTGIKMAIPKGFVGLIWDRSGLAVKNSIHTLAGVIDAGYRGEVGVVLRNSGSSEFLVEKNMRIAQMIIQPHITAKFEEVDNLDETERNSGGFGSSGTK
jgi:dUTP pyrophosphatase